MPQRRNYRQNVNVQIAWKIKLEMWDVKNNSLDIIV